MQRSLGMQLPLLPHCARRSRRDSRSFSVVAMGNPRRTQRVSQQIMREVSLLMLSDKRVRATMSPEERLGADANLSVVASVTEVVISGDLQVAKVFVSFFGEARGAETAFAGLQKLEGYMRSQVGKAMQMRSVPQLRFLKDDGAERGGRVLTILSRLRDEAAAEAAGKVAALSSSSSDEGSDGEPLLPYDSEEEIIDV